MPDLKDDALALAKTALDECANLLSQLAAKLVELGAHIDASTETVVTDPTPEPATDVASSASEKQATPTTGETSTPIAERAFNPQDPVPPVPAGSEPEPEAPDTSGF